MEQEIKGHGIQSLELGIEILKKIAQAGKPLTITEIANLCGMSKSKLHRYLTSFCRTGFLVKSPELRYSLGTELILLGLKASESIDVKEKAAPYLSKLREILNETVALSLWGENGPFFIRWEESNRAINIGIKVGTQVSVLKSTAGKVFVAFLPEDRTERLVKKEIEKYDIDPEDLQKELAQVREEGYSITEGTLIPGISAISCPVFGQDGEIVAVITVVGLVGVLDISEKSPVIRLLKEQCLALSREMGFKGETFDSTG
ncbi:IclR family transcriptional regulator [Bacillaceae bacterium]